MQPTFALFLMQNRGVAALERLTEALPSEAFEFVVSATDNNVQGDWFERIEAICARSNIRFFDRAEHPAISSDLSLAIGWRWLIKDVKQLVVIHDSLLPKYRGFNPVVTTLLEGDDVLGATAFVASERYDEGDVIAQESVRIEYPCKIHDALQRLVPVIADLATRVLVEYYQTGRLNSTPQRHEDASFSVWRDELDYRMDWRRDSAYLKRFVDSVGYPFAGASTLCNNKKATVVDARPRPDVIVHDRQANIGKVIWLEDGKPTVVCGSGLLEITQMQDDEGRSLLPLSRFRTRFM